MSQDYNNTINLPKTDFPMRAGLPKREPGFLEEWEKQDVYGEMMKKNEGKPLFILHDGPPYANGDIHMGHALNKVLKDFIIRYKNMTGYKAPYIPGWDTHGLPIESQVIKKNKLDRSQMSVAEFRDMCKQFALKYVDGQRAGFKRLGVLGDWEHPYLTLDPKFEAKQIEIFGTMANKGYIYKGLKPVYWCPKDETALAEAEIEYADDSVTTIFVKFKVHDDLGKLSSLVDLDHTYFVIWTTTTWTLPGNMAICLNPDLEYSIIKASNGENYIMAAELAESVCAKAGLSIEKTIATMMGSEFELMTAYHPFMNRDSLLILGDHVTLDAGTGCVHTAPSFGVDDFNVCRRYSQIETSVKMPVSVDARGYLNQYAGPYEGISVFKAHEPIFNDLKESGNILFAEDIVHSYPHCWRCKKPIIFRATEQWFASVDAIKDAAVKACDDIKWYPAWGKERMVSMIRERSDWCISRQRNWGVPIPILYCKKCGKAIVTPETIAIISKQFAEKGSNCWYTQDAKTFLPEGYTCECGGDEFTKETDIMDVWFDSGSTHAAVVDQRDELQFPADIYLEGGDQYRGWFQSSMLTSIAAKGVAPYKTIITHGWTVDGQGRKMSKSLGNGIEPKELLKDYGADLLRLWVSSANYQEDMRIDKKILKQLSNAYLKIRNTCRYMLGNLYDFDPKTEMTAYADMTELDQWALMRLNELIGNVKSAYDIYEFHSVYRAVYNFCVVDMSNIYLDVIKDRLYCETIKGDLRRSAQTTMFIILDALVRLISPILCFTSDEIWQAMPHCEKDDLRNVVYNEMPKTDTKYSFSAEMQDKWDKILAVREDVNKALEEARNEKKIGKPLEAQVIIGASQEAAEFLRNSGENLATLFIVSAVKIEDGEKDGLKGESLGGITVKVEKAEGEKCERCWIFSDTVGKNEKHPTLCSRCANVIG